MGLTEMFVNIYAQLIDMIDEPCALSLIECWLSCKHIVGKSWGPLCAILSSQVVSLPFQSAIHGGCKLLCSNGHLDRSR